MSIATTNSNSTNSNSANSNPIDSTTTPVVGIVDRSTAGPGQNPTTLSTQSTGVAIQRPEPLPISKIPLVVILSGVLGSGKTSTLEHLVAQVQLAPAQKGAIFNERYERLAQADAARVRGIDTATVGGCACCISQFDITEHVRTMLSQGRKLIIIEQSGASDGAELLRALLKTYDRGNVAVRLISLVDSEHLQVPEGVLAPAIVAADVVIQTHTPFSSSHDQTASHATALVRNLRGSGPDLYQSTPGFVSAAVWQRVLDGHVGRRADPAPCDNSAPASQAARAARQQYRDSLATTPLVVHPGTSKAALIDALSRSRVPIDRAKGFIPDPAGRVGWVAQVQYERKDNGAGVIAFGEPVTESEALGSGRGERPMLHLMSYSGAAEVADFIHVGMPDFSERTVAYYLGLYPRLPSPERTEGISPGASAPIRADGDALALQAFAMTAHVQKLPPTGQNEFSKAFLPLLFGYVGWRVALIDTLRKERSDMSKDHTQRSIAASYALCWATVKFGKFLQQGQTPLYPRVLAAKPAGLLFEQLSRVTDTTLYGRSVLNSTFVSDLPAIAAYAVNYERIDPTQIRAAIRHIETQLAGEFDSALRDGWNLAVKQILSVIK